MAAILFNFSNQHRTNGKWMAQWKLLAESYGMDLMAYTNGNGLSKKPPVKQLFPTIKHAQQALPDLEWVFLVAPERPGQPTLEQNRISLRDFEHPTEAVYVLGPDYVELDPNGQKMDHCIQVETQHGTGELHALTIAAIVAYDRWRKANER